MGAPTSLTTLVHRAIGRDTHSLWGSLQGGGVRTVAHLRRRGAHPRNRRGAALRVEAPRVILGGTLADLAKRCRDLSARLRRRCVTAREVVLRLHDVAALVAISPGRAAATHRRRGGEAPPARGGLGDRVAVRRRRRLRARCRELGIVRCFPAAIRDRHEHEHSPHLATLSHQAAAGQRELCLAKRSNHRPAAPTQPRVASLHHADRLDDQPRRRLPQRGCPHCFAVLRGRRAHHAGRLPRGPYLEAPRVFLGGALADVVKARGGLQRFLRSQQLVAEFPALGVRRAATAGRGHPRCREAPPAVIDLGCRRCGCRRCGCRRCGCRRCGCRQCGCRRCGCRQCGCRRCGRWLRLVHFRRASGSAPCGDQYSDQTSTHRASLPERAAWLVAGYRVGWQCSAREDDRRAARRPNPTRRARRHLPLLAAIAGHGPRRWVCDDEVAPYQASRCIGAAREGSAAGGRGLGETERAIAWGARGQLDPLGQHLRLELLTRGELALTRAARTVCAVRAPWRPVVAVAVIASRRRDPDRHRYRCCYCCPC